MSGGLGLCSLGLGLHTIAVLGAGVASEAERG